MFVKFLSPLERLFAAVSTGHAPALSNQLVLEGEGAPSEDALKAALSVATQANPGSTIILDERIGRARWRRGPKPRLTITAAPSWTRASEENAPFLLSPLDVRSGPSCEIVSVTTEGKQCLIFRSLHATMDGLGTLFWAQDFMRALRGEEPLGHPSLVTTEDIAHALGGEPRPTPKPDAIPLFRMQGNPNATGHRWRRVESNRPLKSALLSRIAIAFAQQAWATQPGVVRFNVPADLRYLRRGERTTGNLIGSLHVEVKPETTAEMLSLRLVQQLYEKSAAYSAVYDAYLRAMSLPLIRQLSETTAATARASERYHFTATLSHLGQLVPERLSGGGFTVTSGFFVPQSADALAELGPCAVTLNGLGERVEAVVAMPASYCEGGQLDALASLMRSVLEQE